MKRDRRDVPQTAHREEQRRIAAWITAAVWRQRIAQDSLTAATVVSDALDALGIESEVAAVGAIVECKTLPEPRVFGEHAVVLAPGAGLLADASFDRFGTRVPYLVTDVPASAGSWIQQVGSATVTFVPTRSTPEIADTHRALVMAQGLEVAGVGSHVSFESDALLFAEQPLFPTWSRLRDALDDVDGDAATRLAAFRAMRDDHLVELGYPYSIQDPFMPPRVIAAAA
jgi:hypothetical protein